MKNTHIFTAISKCMYFFESQEVQLNNLGDLFRENSPWSGPGSG